MTKRIHFLSLVLTGATFIAAVAVGSTARAASISISTDVLNGGSAGPGNIVAGTSSSTNEINYVNFIPNNAISTAVVYDNAGHTVDLAPNIYAAGAARGSGQGIQVNTYGPIAGSIPDGDTNLFLAGQPNANNPGFGAHANWVVTVNLDKIRADHSLSNQTLDLSGLFGAWGAIGDQSSTGGNIQGEIWLDGTRIDSMPLSSFSPANDPSFNLLIPSTAHELSFFILNSPTSSNWDDGIFENVLLSTVPEPSSIVAIGGLAAMGLLIAVRQRSKK